MRCQLDRLAFLELRWNLDAIDRSVVLRMSS
jgi:hypothetical protein